jgi:hypothetical protein
LKGPYPGFAGVSGYRSYDVSPDGKRFLVLKNAGSNPETAATIVVVENWHEELKRLVPTK